MPWKVEVVISGLGGQGMGLTGQILGRGAVEVGKHAIQTQSYGAEVRNNHSRSDVILSNEKIHFPQVRKPDILIAMSQSALNRDLKDLKEGGILLIDKDLVKEVPKTKARVFKIPATRIAERNLGSRVYANIVMLGALVRITDIVDKRSLEKAIVDSVSEEARDDNLEAFKIGFEFVQG